MIGLFMMGRQGDYHFLAFDYLVIIDTFFGILGLIRADLQHAAQGFDELITAVIETVQVSLVGLSVSFRVWQFAFAEVMT